MITDEIVEAIDTMIEMCSNEEQAKGMKSIREMLCDFPADWNWESESEYREWLSGYLSCERR